ncbi:hypothetical protein [Mycoplasma sp. P36-A1]|uniref:hypothetical protein n=1 Tax=Mycoplasma sp. P36-A1 TaxID=3252900 RepID=UPI003C2B76AF
MWSKRKKRIFLVIVLLLVAIAKVSDNINSYDNTTYIENIYSEEVNNFSNGLLDDQILMHYRTKNINSEYKIEITQYNHSKIMKKYVLVNYDETNKQDGQILISIRQLKKDHKYYDKVTYRFIPNDKYINDDNTKPKSLLIEKKYNIYDSKYHVQNYTSSKPKDNSIIKLKKGNNIIDYSTVDINNKENILKANKYIYGEETFALELNLK